ncbi:hypothetical protein B4166_3797 [Caldibacillus thermoamylovorans]|uniref:DNA-binding protein n=1 Tax=Caldibacillus thermoamylovorans TaxID=35841 RepID=A0ABD4ABD2_9BACI|nr:hypothetical protein B4166_3797 [Caldibacillus thermoamylovorans]KIO74316.1 hypothetical protein B4167_1444 [Caldibacillus thermoamylovorans]
MSTIRLWIQRYRFPVKQKLFAVKEKVYVIAYEDFWEWAEEKRRADQISCHKIKPWTKEDD